MGAASLNPTSSNPGLTSAHAMALALVTRRGLTYREVAVRMGRTDREVLRLLTEALVAIGQTLDEPNSNARRRVRRNQPGIPAVSPVRGAS